MWRATVALSALVLAATGYQASHAQNHTHYLPHDGGDCTNAHGLLSILEEVEHALVASMNRFIVDTDTGEILRLSQLISASNRGSEFYFIEADVALGEPPGQFCITYRGRNLEVNDYRQDRPPRVTGHTFNQADASAACEALERETEGLLCGHRDLMLANARRFNGERLALQGNLVDENGDERAVVTLIADPENEQYFTILATFQSGATTVIGGGNRFEFAPQIIEFFDQRQD